MIDKRLLVGIHDDIEERSLRMLLAGLRNFLFISEKHYAQKPSKAANLLLATRRRNNQKMLQRCDVPVLLCLHLERVALEGGEASGTGTQLARRRCVF